MFTMRQVDEIGRMPGMVRELMAEKLQMRPANAGAMKWEELSHEEQVRPPQSIVSDHV